MMSGTMTSHSTTIRDDTNELIAQLYLDPYSRPADKKGGAWMNPVTSKSRALGTIPVTYVICNQTPPVVDAEGHETMPSLMSLRDVETLFHEFGHMLQNALTTVPYGDASGINNVLWDAVELPSQFMENFVLEKKTLEVAARHYQTGEVLPQELVEKVKAQKTYMQGMFVCRQLLFGSLDMTLHASYDPSTIKIGEAGEVDYNGVESPYQIQQRVASKYAVMPPLREDRFLNGFSHIFAGGYSAGYYSYMWALILSDDAYGAFEEAGLDNETAVVEMGRRFRDTVLSLGGGTHPGEVFRLFRERDPSPEPLLQHLGFKA